MSNSNLKLISIGFTKLPDIIKNRMNKYVTTESNNKRISVTANIPDSIFDYINENYYGNRSLFARTALINLIKVLDDKYPNGKKLFQGRTDLMRHAVINEILFNNDSKKYNNNTFTEKSQHISRKFLKHKKPKIVINLFKNDLIKNHIISFLNERGTLTYTDLSGILNISYEIARRNINKIKEEKSNLLVKTKISGKTAYYLNKEVLNECLKNK